MSTPDAIRLEQAFTQPVGRVFEAFRNPRDLERWAWGSLGKGTRATVDFREGGTFTVSTAQNDGTRWAMSGTYTEILPNRRIAHTLAWDAQMGYGPVPETIVAEFAPAGDGCTLVFRHEGAFGEKARDGHAKGWADVLRALREALEQDAVR
jgi:uncharacterized protein YndB with AHSA1/START domain